MKEYLEKVLHQCVSIRENKELYDKLPLIFKGKYKFFDVETNGIHWFAIQPKSDIGLVALRKDRTKVENISGLYCTLFLNSITPYIKEKLLEEGIPFVLEGKQVYLPFIGYLLSDSGVREIAPVHRISFLTQKLILTAIYEKWDKITVSEAAMKLDVSKMSISRCFDEIEYLNLDILFMKGKSRVITISHNVKQLWKQIQPVLRNPVIARYELSKDMHLEKKAGITALCEYSMLSDNVYPTYAITKKEVSKTEIKKQDKIHRGEDIGCVVLELGYFIDYNQKLAEDPISIFLSLTDEEKNEERVMIVIKKIMEEYIWSKD